MSAVAASTTFSFQCRQAASDRVKLRLQRGNGLFDAKSSKGILVLSMFFEHLLRSSLVNSMHTKSLLIRCGILYVLSVISSTPPFAFLLTVGFF